MLESIPVGDPTLLENLAWIAIIGQTIVLAWSAWRAFRLFKVNREGIPRVNVTVDAEIARSRLPGMAVIHSKLALTNVGAVAAKFNPAETGMEIDVRLYGNRSGWRPEDGFQPYPPGEAMQTIEPGERLSWQHVTFATLNVSEVRVTGIVELLGEDVQNQLRQADIVVGV